MSIFSEIVDETRLEIIFDEEWENQHVDEIVLAREIQEATYHHEIDPLPIHLRVFANVPCTFGSMLQTAGIQSIIERIQLLDLVKADVTEQDAAHLIRYLPNLQALEFHSETLQGTQTILDSIPHKEALLHLSIVRSTCTGSDSVASFVNGIDSNTFGNLQELELDLCVSSDEAVSGLVGNLQTLDILKRLQSLTITLAGRNARNSHQTLYHLADFVTTIRSFKVMLKISIMEMPQLFSVQGKSLDRFVEAFQAKPPLDFYVRGVGLSSQSVEAICSIGTVNASNSFFGILEEALLEGSMLRSIRRKLPFMKVQNLLLVDKGTKKWPEEKKQDLLEAIHRNTSLYHLHCSYGDKCSSVFRPKELAPIFDRNKCIDLTRFDSNQKIPLPLWPHTLELFGKEELGHTPTFLFLQTQLWSS